MDASLGAGDSSSPRRSLVGSVVRAQAARLLFGSDDHVRIGRYRIERVLGRGGMGEVFVAHDPRLNRDVALKVLRAVPNGNDELARLRLLREAQVMARLKHPNVVTVYDVGTHEHQVYVAMELVEGGTLRDWCEREPRGWAEILAMFVEAGDGLAAAHRAGIVHRDFKPENVLVSEGRPQVVDFGIARAAGEIFDREPSESQSEALLDTLTAGVMGTPAFMSPEQFAGRTADASSDQFGFCAALWNALYGELPFEGDALEIFRANVMEGRRRRPPRRPRIPGRVRAAIERGLSRDPADRFPTMGDLLAELGPKPRHRWVALSASGLLGIAIGGAALFMRPHGQDLCRDGEERIESAWNDERRTELLRTLGPSRDTALVALDAHVWQWSSALAEACEGPDVRRYSKLSCLEWRLAELDTVTDVLRHADASEDPTWQLHQVLTPAERCLDPEYLRAAPPPPDDAKTRSEVQQARLELASVRIRQDPRSADRAAELAEAARSIGYGPLQAETQLVLGELLSAWQRPDQAVTALEDAARLGRRFHPEIEARAYVHLVWMAAFSHDHRVKIRYYAEEATHAIERLGDRPRLSAELNLKLAQALSFFGDPDDGELALASAEAAVKYFEKIGKPSALAHAYYGLILTVVGEHDAARFHTMRAMEVSPPSTHEHRRVVGVTGIVHAIQGYDSQARLWLEQCVNAPSVEGPARPLEVGACSSWLGNVLRRSGDTEAAMKAHDRALTVLVELLGPDHLLVARAHAQRGETHRVRGELDRADADFDEASRIFASVDEAFAELLIPRLGRARTMLARGQLERARRLLEEEVEASLPSPPIGHFPEAQAHLTFAQVYSQLGQHALARARARQALEIYAEVGPAFAEEASLARELATEEEIVHDDPG